MDVLVIGTPDRIGDVLAQKLLFKGDTVRGLVRRDERWVEFVARGVRAVVGDRIMVSVEALAAVFGNVESTVFSTVFSAATEGDSVEATRTMGDGARKVVKATRLAGNRS